MPKHCVLEHKIRFFSDVNLTTNWAVVTHTFVAESTTQFPRISNHSGVGGIQIECEYLQLEHAPHASSYIPTASAPTTRATDNIRCDSIADTFAGMARGVFILDFDLDHVPVNPNWQDIIICAKPGASTHNFRIEISPAGRLRVYLQVGTDDTHKNFHQIMDGPLSGRYRLALFIDDNGQFKTSMNGDVVRTKTISSPNFLSQLEEFRFGAFFSPTFTFVSVLDEDPSDARLQELSAI